MKKKTSDRVEATRKRVGASTEDLIHSAADRVGPLAQSAADAVAPLAQAATDRLAPYASQASERITPLGNSARERGAHVAQGAAAKLGHRLDQARIRMSPTVETARDRVNAEVLPKITGAVGAAVASPVAVETVRRGKAAVAAAKGEVVLSEETPKRRWIGKTLAVLGVAVGVGVAVKKILSSKDSEWQAAKPSAPYAAPEPAAAGSWSDATDSTLGAAGSGSIQQSTESGSTFGSVPTASPSSNGDVSGVESVDPDPVVGDTSAGLDSDASDDPDTPESAHEVYAEANASDDDVPEAEDSATDPAPVGEPAADAEGAGEPVHYEGEGAYVGDEPPEGFTIKGNERSKKYHLPDSPGYVPTQAEVWFNSEEAAQQAGFEKAQS